MWLDVQVALMGDPDEPIRPGVLDERFIHMPYAQRRKVALEVEEHESLAEVLRRAADAMGLRPDAEVLPYGFDLAHNSIAFYKADDDDGFAGRWVPRYLLHELVLVDQDGRAIFGVIDLRAVRFTDLLRASEAGVIDGDPLRPYLILDFGWGDAPPPDWTAVQQAFEVAWQALEAFGVARTAVEAIQWLGKRIGRIRQALAAHPEWMQKGYRPDQFLRLLAIRDWTADQLAPLLGCSEPEAEAVLWAMGFALDPEGRREANADETAKMLTDIVHAVGWASKEGPGWEPRFRAWLMRYFETGERPPFESLRRMVESEESDGYFEYKPTPGERLDALLTRFRRRS